MAEALHAAWHLHHDHAELLSLSLVPQRLAEMEARSLAPVRILVDRGRWGCIAKAEAMWPRCWVAKWLTLFRTTNGR